MPIVVGLSVAYFKGHTQLNEVIGGSFEALARDSASKLDAEILRVIAADRDLAKQAASDAEIRNALMASSQDNGTRPIAVTRLLWPAHKKDDQSRWLLRASWITGPGGETGGTEVHNDPSNPTGIRISGLRLDKEQHRYIFRISAPILDHKDSVLLGWLHRDYDVKYLLDPLVYPIRFGETGHVMIIDNLGSIVSCPDLV
ncbi:MAG: hypothetical protein GY809_04545, partial [Planctomycetes bacterium]|nr:hypothetical protein [Planctomycetota bacterium]